jgi:hypothetical protein
MTTKEDGSEKKEERDKMVISSKAQNKGEGTFSLAFELYLLWFYHFPNLVKTQPNLALQRAGQKPILNYPDWTRSKCLITNPQAPRRC